MKFWGIIIFLFILLGIIPDFIAQSLSFKRQDSIQIINQSVILKNPWSGGLNYPQFSEIDLNGDGIKDLFTFDRSGYKIRTFLNKGIVNQASYSYAPQFEQLFPQMHDWVLLADYNCDGKEDIFTYSIGGMAVYRNDYNTISGLQFTLVSSLILSDYGSNNISNLYLTSPSIPALSDVDYDGDLDVITFDISGSYVEFHKNMSKEWYGNCDSLKFVLSDPCWGKFTANFSSNSVKLGISCKGGSGKIEREREHAGSTLLVLDMDGDHDKDLLVGDLISTNILYLNNGGDATQAVMTSQDSAFPSNSVPVKLRFFPALFLLDVDNDGMKDIIAAPNTGSTSENYNGIWFYKNTGTQTSPVFEFQKAGFLQDEMIDAGEDANPALLDFNMDGLMDIIVGNYGYFSSSGSYKSQLMVLKNTGNTNKPSFSVETLDYSGLSTYPVSGIFPYFSDMDDDNDPDMICGISNGQLMYFDNIAGAGNSPSFSLVDANYKLIDIGEHSVPVVFDLNEDGLKDLILGEKAGNLNYFKNTGINTVPYFSQIPDNNLLGKIDVMKSCCGGYTSPVFFEKNKTIFLLLGTEKGTIYYYDNIQNNVNGSFHLIDSTFLGINEGSRARLALGDLNGDGLPDLVIGNLQGGLAIYFQESSTEVFDDIRDLKSSKLLPVPADNLLILESPNAKNIKIEIYDMMGKCIFTTYQNSKTSNINTADFSNGMYVCKITSEKKVESIKFIIHHP